MKSIRHANTANDSSISTHRAQSTLENISDTRCLSSLLCATSRVAVRLNPQSAIVCIQTIMAEAKAIFPKPTVPITLARYGIVMSGKAYDATCRAESHAKLAARVLASPLCAT